MTVTAAAIVARFAPAALPAYAAAFRDPDGLLASAGIATPLRVAHFMAQVMEETGALTVAVENGRYGADALGRMWDSGNWHLYFPDRAACVAMAESCRRDQGQALFNRVYGGRMGNGPATSGDGWRYRGRGVLQTTGRAAYARHGARWRVDFEGRPDLVVTAEHALKPAIGEWSDKHVNAAADHNDIRLVTRLVNGGQIALDRRRAWFARIWPFVIGAPPVEQSIAWRVQAALVAAGFDPGQPDGVVGPRTRAAILAYRAANGSPGAPAIDGALLLMLGLG